MIKVFKMQHNTVQEVGRVLDELANIVKPDGDNEYIRLFCQDAEVLVDNIALNILPRPNEPLFDGLIQELDRKINLAIAAKFPTKYNICVTASVITRKNNTYVLISCESDFCRKSLENSGFKELKAKDTAELMQSNATITFSKQLYPNGNINITDDKMIFASVEERSEKRARYHVQSDLLKCVAAGKDIQKYQLNDYFDQIFELLSKDAISSEIAGVKMRLQTILPDITPELIKFSPAQLNELAQQQAKLKQGCSRETEDSDEDKKIDNLEVFNS